MVTMFNVNLNQDINPDYVLIKSTLETEDTLQLESLSKKLDESNYGFIYPPVSAGITEYVLKHNGRLRKCTLVLAQDTILQDYIFKDNNGEPIFGDTKSIGFWNKKNKYNLYLAVMQRYQYGYGACEVIYNDAGEVSGLLQIPSQTMCIQKTDDNVYYAVQNNMNVVNRKFRIYNLLDTYPKSDDELPIVLWLGGSETYRFYDVPVWYPDCDSILGQINLNLLTAQQINEGNSISGILNINGPPQRPNPNTGLTVEEQIRQQMKKTGTGVMVSYLESASKDFPINYEFIKISQDNYDYLESFSKNVDDSIMSEYCIPKVRLMIDDTTESMNSNKSDTIWQIYAISLQYEQFSNELIIQEFNQIFFDENYELDMSIPIFSDKRQIELSTVDTLFKSGLLTIGEAITKISEYYPELKINEKIDLDDPLMSSRFFNGNALGFSEDVDAGEVNTVESVLEYFK